MAAHKKNNIISENSDKPNSKESSHYVSKDDLYNEFVIWGAAKKLAEDCGEEPPRIPEAIGKGILQIANQFAKKHNWQTNSSYRQEMVSDAVLNCIKYINNFNTERSKNPFSYFTQISYFSFLRTIHNEKTQDYVKHKSTLSSQVFQDFINGKIDDEDLILEDFEYNVESVEDFIGSYEKKVFGKKLDANNALNKILKTDEDKIDEEIGMF